MGLVLSCLEAGYWAACQMACLVVLHLTRPFLSRGYRKSVEYRINQAGCSCSVRLFVKRMTSFVPRGKPSNKGVKKERSTIKSVPSV